jgi:hypothetical protein
MLNESNSPTEEFQKIIQNYKNSRRENKMIRLMRVNETEIKIMNRNKQRSEIEQDASEYDEVIFHGFSYKKGYKNLIYDKDINDVNYYHKKSLSYVNILKINGNNKILSHNETCYSDKENSEILPPIIDNEIAKNKLNKKLISLKNVNNLKSSKAMIKNKSVGNIINARSEPHVYTNSQPHLNLHQNSPLIKKICQIQKNMIEKSKHNKEVFKKYKLDSEELRRRYEYIFKNKFV